MSPIRKLWATRIDHQGYVDESGSGVVKQNFWWEYDFSDGLSQVLVADSSQKSGEQGLFLNSVGKVVAKVPAFGTGEFSERFASY